MWYVYHNAQPIIANATFTLPLFSEEGIHIGKVFAIDPDADQSLLFSIRGTVSHFVQGIDGMPFSSFFDIQPNTGVISLSDASLFNHFVSEVYLPVMVVDDGIPSLNNTFGFELHPM